MKSINTTEGKGLSQYIDHTHLKPQANCDEIEKLCLEASEYGFYSVCVNPFWIKDCVKFLKCSETKICTVIGFPLGANHKEIKRQETLLAKSHGANEFDMVINIGALKDQRLEDVVSDIRGVVKAASPYPVKVILETCLLTDAEIVTACRLARKAGAHFVKTSTGFSQHGATLEAVELMAQTVGKEMGVKASGGIRDRKTAISFIQAGATRIGTSSSLKIVKALSNDQN